MSRTSRPSINSSRPWITFFREIHSVRSGIRQARRGTVPPLRDSLAASHVDPHDLDAFVLDREVVGLLQDLVPEGAGESWTSTSAFCTTPFSSGWRAAGRFSLSRARAEMILKQETASPNDGTSVPRAYYIQFPERLVWAELESGAPHEPLDGLFVRPGRAGGILSSACSACIRPGKASPWSRPMAFQPRTRRGRTAPHSFLR